MGLINVDLQCGLVFGELKLNDMNQVMGKFSFLNPEYVLGGSKS